MPKSFIQYDNRRMPKNNQPFTHISQELCLSLQKNLNRIDYI